VAAILALLERRRARRSRAIAALQPKRRQPDRAPLSLHPGTDHRILAHRDFDFHSCWRAFGATSRPLGRQTAQRCQLVRTVRLGLLPVSGSGSFAHLVLPAVTMGSALAAILTRMVRTSMLEELGHDYVRTARAKGLPEHTVVYRHALRNAMLPIITVLGLQFGALLAGAIVTEKIFSWPGIGRLTIDAIGNRDYFLVQGCILAIGLTYVLVNFLTDLLYSVANPRIRQ
jgi:hypothetical protein